MEEDNCTRRIAAFEKKIIMSTGKGVVCRVLSQYIFNSMTGNFVVESSVGVIKVTLNFKSSTK